MGNSKYITGRISLLSKRAGYNFDTVFAAAFGSYNYGIHTNASDLDIKIVYIPSIDSMINYENKSIIYKIRSYGEDEAEVIALPYYIQLIKQFDIAKLEVLFAPSYIWVNPKHKKIFQDIQRIALELVLTQKKKFICSILNVMQRIDIRFINSTSNIFNPHKAYNVPRLFILLKHVLYDDKYQLEIDEELKESISNMKWGVKNRDETMKECSTVIANTENLIDCYADSDPSELHLRLDDIVRNAILAPHINRVIDEQEDIIRYNNLISRLQLHKYKIINIIFAAFSMLMLFVLISRH